MLLAWPLSVLLSCHNWTGNVKSESQMHVQQKAYFSASAVILTTLTAIIPGFVLWISRFKQEEGKRNRLIWKSLPFDTLALGIQITGKSFEVN